MPKGIKIFLLLIFLVPVIVGGWNAPTAGQFFLYTGLAIIFVLIGALVVYLPGEEEKPENKDKHQAGGPK